MNNGRYAHSMCSMSFPRLATPASKTLVRAFLGPSLSLPWPWAIRGASAPPVWPLWSPCLFLGPARCPARPGLVYVCLLNPGPGAPALFPLWPFMWPPARNPRPHRQNHAAPARNSGPPRPARKPQPWSGTLLATQRPCRSRLPERRPTQRQAAHGSCLVPCVQLLLWPFSCLLSVALFLHLHALYHQHHRLSWHAFCLARPVPSALARFLPSVRGTFFAAPPHGPFWHALCVLDKHPFCVV